LIFTFAQDDVLTADMSLEPRDYTVEEKGLCKYLIQDGLHFFVLGQAFVRKYYILLDAKEYQVGFTEAGPTKKLPKPPVMPLTFNEIVIIALVVASLIGIAACVCYECKERKRKKNLKYRPDLMNPNLHATLSTFE